MKDEPIIVPVRGIMRHVSLTETEKAAGDALARALEIRSGPETRPGHAALHRAVCSGLVEVRRAGTPAEESSGWLRWNPRKKKVAPGCARGAKD